MRGPHVIDIPLHCDDRGYVYCALDSLDSLEIKRTYVVENFIRGRIRAWHGHLLGDTYLHVISGAAKVAALEHDASCHNSGGQPYGKHLVIATLTARKPQLFYVPRGYFNGHMSLEDNTKILVYSTLTFEQVKVDDKRMSSEVLKHVWKVEDR